MKHTMKLQKEPFEAILRGKKKIELRLNDEKRQQIQIGDTILFTFYDDTEKELTGVVKALHHADSFAALLEKLSLYDCGFEDNTDANTAAATMRKYYSEEEEQKYGVLGIELDIL